jgi:hypothetical protein
LFDAKVNPHLICFSIHHDNWPYLWIEGLFGLLQRLRYKNWVPIIWHRFSLPPVCQVVGGKNEHVTKKLAVTRNLASIQTDAHALRQRQKNGWVVPICHPNIS